MDGAAKVLLIPSLPIQRATRWREQVAQDLCYNGFTER